MVMSNQPDLFSSTDVKDEPIRVLYLDTETTGADPETAHVCEIALLLSTYDGFRRRTAMDETLEELVQPPVEVPPEASAVHHITNEMLASMPALKKLEGGVSDLVEKADILCAHNISYDLGILRRELPDVFGGKDRGSQLDSLRLSRHLWPMIPSHALQSLRYRFKLDNVLQGDAHRAMFDSMLSRALVEHVLDCGLVKAENWMELISYVDSPLEVKIFSFGKYRGKLVEDIAVQDRDYIKWLLRQDWMPAEYPDLYHTLISKTGSAG